MRPGASIESVAQALAARIRRREWYVPGALTDASDRIFMNFRPLLRDLGGEEGARLWHKTRGPPIEGEWNWERRSIVNSMWIMADQVDNREWILYLKVQWARPEDYELGQVLESVLRDLAL